MTLLDQITLPYKLSNNNGGQGRAWYMTHKDRLEIERVIEESGKRREIPFLCKVALKVVRIYPKKSRCRKWDYDSVLRGNSKQIIDALTAAGWFLDDGANHICQVVGDQEQADVEHEMVRIEVYDKPAVFE